MTDEQKAKFEHLSYCTFAVGSPDKRFVRDMRYFEGDLTAKQASYLDRLCYRYRKQLERIMRKEPERWAKWRGEGFAAVIAQRTSMNDSIHADN